MSNGDLMHDNDRLPESSPETLEDKAEGTPSAEELLAEQTNASGEAGPSSSPLAIKRPDIESLHRDLATANAYRQEFIKSLILIAGGLFAFSVSFRPELKKVVNEELFWAAWTALGVSMLGGFAQLAAWERFYSSFQRYEYKGQNGKHYRRLVTTTRRAALLLQVAGFIAGVASLGSFTALNLANVEKPSSVRDITARSNPEEKASTAPSSKAAAPQ